MNSKSQIMDSESLSAGKDLRYIFNLHAELARNHFGSVNCRTFSIGFVVCNIYASLPRKKHLRFN